MRYRFIKAFLITLSLLVLSGMSTASPAIYDDNDPQRLLRGAFYFRYLEGDYSGALHRLKIWREYRSDASVSAPPDAESLIMEAAIYLALGMEGEAHAIYQQVEQSGLSASGDAWFHLARRWMELSRWPDAEKSIGRALELSSTLNPQYQQQALFIQSSSRSHQDKVAQSVLSPQMINESIWAGLARYNRILAAMRLNANSRDLEKWVEEAVFYLPEDDYESQALRDRILLIAGIYALDSGKQRRAEVYFREVSQNTVFTAPALLHYGWALVEQWKYQKAMQPWRVLQQQFNDFHPAVIESVLGVPHALELLNATTQSLKTYEVVEGRLQKMLAQVRSVNNSEVINGWMDSWLEQPNFQSGSDANAAWGWLNNSLADMPDHDLTRTLQSVLDDNEFNQLVIQLRDLQQLQRQLKQQETDLLLWQEVVRERQQRLQQLGGAQRLNALEQRHQQLLSQVMTMQRAVDEEDAKVFAYASAADKNNINNLAAVVPAVEYLQVINDPTRDLSVYKERWRRVRGVQLWNIYQDKPERRWQAQQSFWQLRKNSEQLAEQLSNSRIALSWANSSWQGFPQQVSQALQRAAAQQQRVDVIYLQQREQLVARVQQHLNDLNIRLSDYLAQSRLSIARLYDDALQNHVIHSSEAGSAKQGGSDE